MRLCGKANVGNLSGEDVRLALIRKHCVQCSSAVIL